MLLHRTLALLATLLLQSLPATQPTNTATAPVPWLERDSYDWYQRHAEVLEIQRKLDPQVVLIGDSITHFWSGLPQAKSQNGPQSWAGTFGPLRVLNMGFGWDRTQNVLHRLAHGQLDDLHPDLVILNIGTNNFSATKNARANTPEEIAEAIGVILQKVQEKTPTTKILVMAVFPRGHDATDPRRAPIESLNALLAAQLKDKPGITFLDLKEKFLASDGTLPKDLFPDGTHPSDKGYAIWGNALKETGLLPPPR